MANWRETYETMHEFFTNCKETYEIIYKTINETMHGAFNEIFWQLMRWKREMSSLETNLRLEKELKFREQQIRELDKELKRELRENQMLEDKYQAELTLEREEFYKALQKAQEWRERQLKEITEQKDQEIKNLKEQVSQLQSQLTNLPVEKQITQIEVPPKN